VSGSLSAAESPSVLLLQVAFGGPLMFIVAGRGSKVLIVHLANALL